MSALRTYATRFVGRREDLAALDRVLHEGSRLVTVLGPGGVGKTRLAVEHGIRSGAGYAGGTFFCDLTEATSALGLCHDVARALEAPALAGSSDAETIAHLGQVLSRLGRALLILDNVEQIAEPAARAIAEWLAVAPEVSFVVTSRERLRVDGEAVLDLEPLETAAAAELFVERARAVKRGFEPTAEDAAAIDRIVKRLEGLPLAIELAAARMRVLSAPDLAGQLVDRLDVLGRGGRERPARQATLEATLEWSWGMLRPWEQRALAECAVFRGGFDVAAAQAVLDLGDFADAPAVVDVLEALRDKSLIRSADPPELPGASRLALYESVREFAHRKLEESGRLASVRERHAAHYLFAGAELEGAVEGRDPTIRKRLLLEVENLIAAQRWGLESSLPPSERAAVALGAALGLEPVLLTRGPMHLALAIFEAGVGAALEPGAVVEPSLLVRGLLGRAQARLRRGMLSESRADVDRAREAARSIDGSWLGMVERAEYQLAWSQGRLAVAIAHAERALAIAREHDDRRLAARALVDLARAHGLRGDPAAAAPMLEEALRIQQELGGVREEAGIQVYLGVLAFEQGRDAEARTRFERAREMARAIGDPGLAAHAELDMASERQAHGLYAEALELYQSAVRCYRDMGSRLQEGLCLGFLGSCYEEMGERAEARRAYEDALAIDREAGNELMEGLTLGWLGRLDATEDNVEAAERHLDAAAVQLESVGDRVRWEVVYLCRGHLDLALARKAEAKSDARAATKLRRAARDRLEAARAGQAGSYSDRAADVRAAMRMLERALAQLAPVPSRPPRPHANPPSDAPPGALVIAADGRWFRAPGGNAVSLETRGSLRHLLAHLAEQRRDTPGKASSAEDLFGVGWKGERALGKSGAARVYVAMSTLRGLGLRNLLRRRDDGYLLDPETPFHMADPAPRKSRPPG